MSENLTPALRFNGFTDDWVQRQSKRHVPAIRFDSFLDSWRLMPFCRVYRKINEKNGKSIFYGADRIISVAQMQWTMPEKDFDSDYAKTYNVFRLGDIAYEGNRSGGFTYGRFVVNDIGDGIVSHVFDVYSPVHDTSLDLTFARYFINNDIIMRDVLRKSTTRATMMNSLDANSLYKQHIQIPQIIEQKKIGTLLHTLDKLVVLCQRKLELLQRLKQAMLQQMFPDKGKDIPQLRFKGFNDTWEQRKASDIADYSKGSGYSKSDLLDTGTPIILYGRLYTKYQFSINDVDTFADLKDGAVLSQGDEVIIPASGETAEEIARAAAVEESGILLGGDLNILHPYDFISSSFLALVISNGSVQKELSKKAQGKSVVHIHNSDIQELAVRYPSKPEQERIGTFFKKLDNLITLHQRELERYEQLKKFLLQQMFV